MAKLTGRPAAERRASLEVRVARQPVSRGFTVANTETYNGYCVKCKEKRDFEGEVHESNNRRMAKGKCPVCGTTVNRILGKA